uniref:Uncharacterized protein n=1 Tax=Leptobrachium leishanense TaxID=445787 RepID=A0A8C5MPF9_9ANUR
MIPLSLPHTRQSHFIISGMDFISLQDTVPLFGRGCLASRFPWSPVFIVNSINRLLALNGIFCLQQQVANSSSTSPISHGTGRPNVSKVGNMPPVQDPGIKPFEKEKYREETQCTDANAEPTLRLEEWFYNPVEEHHNGSYLPPIHYSLAEHPNCDLFWKPSARWLPSPRYPDAPFPHIKDCKFPENIRLLRSYPRSNEDVQEEWSFYPNLGLPFTYHTGKRCTFHGRHFSNRASENTQALSTCLGRKRKVADTRNGIPEANPGDKPFHIPEYSPNFHRFGSTRPVVNFKSSYKVKADTFIPLLKLPQTPW